jgi:hypothetical protein
MIPHFHLYIRLDIVEPLLGYQIRTPILCLKKYCFTHHSSWKMWAWGLLHKLIVMSRQFSEQKMVGINISSMLQKVVLEIVSCITRTHWKHYLLCFHHLVSKRTFKLHQAMVFTKVFILSQLLACGGYKCRCQF